MEERASSSSSTPKFALEVQAPFSRYILDGSKSIETRSYPLTDNLLGKSIMLCESTPGIDSVSAVNDVVPAGQADLSMIGEIIVSSCTEYMSQSSFDNDRPSHLVPVGSTYDWSPTPAGRRWAWFIDKVIVYDEAKTVPAMKRSFRSIFEIL